MTQNFVFKNKGAEFWSAQTRHVTRFEDVVRWFEREQGMKKAMAQRLARHSRPDLFNQFMARAHRQTL